MYTFIKCYDLILKAIVSSRDKNHHSIGGSVLLVVVAVRFFTVKSRCDAKFCLSVFSRNVPPAFFFFLFFFASKKSYLREAKET